MEDDFNELFVSKEMAIERVMLQIVKPFLKIVKEDKSILPEPEFDKLSEKHKILVYLVTKQILSATDENIQEECSPSEISNKLGTNPSTCRYHLSIMHKEGLLGKNKKGYFVPNYNLNKIRGVIFSNE